MVKQRNERNLLFPSKEFRDRVRSAAKERGFRSEQAFILTACENELKRGSAADATERLEASVAATLANFAKDQQALFTLAHGQFALTNSLLQYVLTCMVEPPDDVLEAARARAKARYTKILRHAGQEVATRNKATLEEVLTRGKIMMRDPSGCGQSDRVAIRMTIPGNMEERSDHSFDSFKWRTDEGQPRTSALKPKCAHVGTLERRERTANGSRFGSHTQKTRTPANGKRTEPTSRATLRPGKELHRGPGLTRLEQASILRLSWTLGRRLATSAFSK